MSDQVLVIDDEKNITAVIQAILEQAGLDVLCVGSGEEAVQRLKSSVFGTVITDLYMPGKGGMEVLEFCKKHHPSVPVVIITAHGTVEAAVSALKNGAFDFITKPFDKSELLNVVNKAIQTFHQSEKEPGGEASLEVTQFSSRMQDISKVIDKIAASPTTVLIRGESGTGKELVAFEIHRKSDRSKKPFIKINCAAIPATLIESELFGYEKGAFTGAITAKPGRFELAHEGTLFLDEVAEMPLEMQVKLLRVLQEHEFERVGGLATIHVDARIVAATNKDLEAEVRAGRIREDLYYRLNVVPIYLPPLRERASDIEELVHVFIKQFNVKLKKDISGLTPACLSALRAYGWPGNIRQLENVLERMMLMAESEILDVVDLPAEIQPPQHSMEEVPEKGIQDLTRFKELVKMQTRSIEKELIIKALEETQGNVTRAAEMLRLSRKGLQLKLRELGIRNQG